MQPLRLYWRPGTSALAPHAALAEIGLAYELIRIERETAQTDPDYLALNPLGVVPTLVDGATVVTESAAILLYLADRYPGAGLIPAERADFYRWLIFMTNTLQTTLLRFLYPERYGADGVREIAAADAAQYFDLIDERLEGREWLAGDQRTVADSASSCSPAGGAGSSPRAGAARISAGISSARSRSRVCAA